MSEPMNNAVLHSAIRVIDDEIKARKIVREQLLLSYCETHGIVNGCRVLRDGKEFQIFINQGNPPRGWERKDSICVCVLAYPIKKDGNMSAVGAVHPYVDELTVITK